MRRLASWALLILFPVALLCFAGGTGENSVKPPGSAPAEVDHRVLETSLTTVRVTEEAERRLGLQTAEAESRPVPRTRLYPGHVLIPPGRAVTVAAPAPARWPFLRAGIPRPTPACA